MYAPLAHERLYIFIQCFILVWHSSVDGNVNLMVWRLVHHFSLVNGFMYQHTKLLIMWWFWEQYTADSGVCDAVRLIEPWTWSNLVKKKKKKKIGLFFFFWIKGSAPSAGSSPLQLLLPCGEPRTRHTHTPISLAAVARACLCNSNVIPAAIITTFWYGCICMEMLAQWRPPSGVRLILLAGYVAS